LKNCYKFEENINLLGEAKVQEVHVGKKSQGITKTEKEVVNLFQLWVHQTEMFCTSTLVLPWLT